jgi:endosialidase-like protein
MRHLTALVLGLAVVSVALAPVDPAHAQGWTDTGSVVHLTTNGDRVGIGTTAPGAKLHVMGSVLVSGRVTTNIISSHPGTDLRFRADGVDVLRLERTAGSPNVIGGSSLNEVSDGVRGATIAGGGNPIFVVSPNIVTDDFGTVGGGRGNQAGDAAGATTDADGATVAGGIANTAQGQMSAVGGGVLNVAGGEQATIAGGGSNAAGGANATIGGGGFNLASGAWSTVPGGRRGQALHMGTFVWADSTDADFASQANNQFLVRSTGGAQFVSAVNGAGVATAGVTLAVGGNSWGNISDRSVKDNVAAVDGSDILRRLSAVPITRWNLKAQDPAIKHVGPMAQDFYAAFGLGEDERYINSADVDGIALVSIQVLYELVTALEQKTTAVDRKAAELDRKTADLERIAAGVDELRARLTRFEQSATR